MEDQITRRKFIKVTTGIAAGTAVVALVPSIFTGCASTSNSETEPWRGPDASEEDIRRIVLSYAILAPSSHNTQPWMLRYLDERTIALYVDPVRLLPETDPEYRQIHVSQGTFIENLVLAARHYGYRADLSYFPDGMYEDIEARPVAQIRLTRDATVPRDPLFDQITKRRTNRKEFDKRPISDEHLASLTHAYNDLDFPLKITSDPALMEPLVNLCTAGMQVEVNDEARNAETLAMFRFNGKEIEEHRDGLGFSQLGLGGVSRMFAGSFISRESAESDPAKFFDRAIENTKKQAASASAFGWISSFANTRLDQVLAGRMYQRVHLTATSLGIEVHPMSQTIQEYPDMENLRRELYTALKVPQANTIQMLFRLGHAGDVAHSARRNIDDLFLG